MSKLTDAIANPRMTVARMEYLEALLREWNKKAVMTVGKKGKMKVCLACGAKLHQEGHKPDCLTDLTNDVLAEV